MRATMAIILARGLGSRLRADDGAALAPAQREAAAKGAKGLMPIAGRPFLDYTLHEFAEAGVKDVVFVVAPDDDALRDRYDEQAPPNRLRVRYAVQDEPRGTAHALLAARDVILAAAGAPRCDDGHRHFLVANADNLYPATAIHDLLELHGPGVAAFDAESLVGDGLMERERVRRFALLDIGADGGLRDVVEKPEASHPLMQRAPQWVSMNLWRFDDRILDDCAAVEPSSRGELELQDAVLRAIARGDRFQAVEQRLAVPDLTHRRDIAVLEGTLAQRHPRP
ncbi:MAG: nucleotidyltransferase family protein [Gemmatimonadaceae bacterium]|nr:nucleotidyltransferase family protein [Gemmatimonadaceae bacterium]